MTACLNGARALPDRLGTRPQRRMPVLCPSSGCACPGVSPPRCKPTAHLQLLALASLLALLTLYFPSLGRSHITRYIIVVEITFHCDRYAAARALAQGGGIASLGVEEPSPGQRTAASSPRTLEEGTGGGGGAAGDDDPVEGDTEAARREAQLETDMRAAFAFIDQDGDGEVRSARENNSNESGMARGGMAR